MIRREERCAWVQQHGLPLSKAGLIAAAVKCPTCQQQTPRLSTWYNALPQEGHWCQDNYIESLLSWKGQRLVQTRINTYSGNGFAFPAYKSSATITIQELLGYFFSGEKSYITLCQRGEPTWLQRRYGSGSMTTGSTGHITHHTAQKLPAWWSIERTCWGHS